MERLAWTDNGRISYKLKRPWPDGRTHLVMEPVAFLRRLVGIIPPPRRHLVRYSGVFGPASKQRAKLRALVPAVDIDADPCTGSGVTAVSLSSTASASRSRRLPWADLLCRVFADDVRQCPCRGRCSVIAIVTDPALARTLLTALGLAREPVTLAPARDPPQADLDLARWDDVSEGPASVGSFAPGTTNVDMLTCPTRPRGAFTYRDPRPREACPPQTPLERPRRMHWDDAKRKAVVAHVGRHKTNTRS